MSALSQRPAGAVVGTAVPHESAALHVTEKAISKHTNSIFGRRGLAQSEADKRRVLAVLAYLRA